MATYNLRYEGEMLTTEGSTLRVRIYTRAQEDASATRPPRPRRLRFPADSPVTIERRYEGKEAVLHGSTLTLKVISEADREFTELYTVDPASVCIDITLDDNRYWSGLLDAETYEEPYQCARDYEVTLRATDMGVLSRARVPEGAGDISIDALIGEAMAAAELGALELYADGISTRVPDGPYIDQETGEPVIPESHKIRLSEVMVPRANFRDRDSGEMATYADALTAMLQPLGLHLTQWRGDLYLYDLNGLHGGATETIEWSGDSQTLGVDSVYSSVKLTFTPGVETDDLLAPVGDFDTPSDSTLAAAEHTLPSLTAVIRTDARTSDKWEIRTTFGTNDASKCNQTDFPGVAVMTRPERADDPVRLADSRIAHARIHDINGGGGDSDTTCIALAWPAMKWTGRSGDADNPYYHANIERHGLQPTELFTALSDLGGSAFLTIPSKAKLLFSTRPIALSPASAPYLKITMETLIDGRLYPWADVHSDPKRQFSEWQSKTAKEQIDRWAWNLRIPVRLLFRTRAGEVYCWRVTPSADQGGASSATMGGWHRIAQAGEEIPAFNVNETVAELSDPTSTFLYYWDNGYADRSSALGGWKANRPAVALTLPEQYESVKAATSGQYIPNPAQLLTTPTDSTSRLGAGELWLEVYGGPWITGDIMYRPAVNAGNYTAFRTSPLWVLCKHPEIVPIARCFPERKPDDKDITFQATVWPNAAEGLELSTTCGSSPSSAAGATGAYHDGRQPIYTLMRADDVRSPEGLLLRTLVGNYGRRHAIITGQALTPATLGPYTERAQDPSARFMLGDCVEDLRAHTADISIVELSPDAS